MLVLSTSGHRTYLVLPCCLLLLLCLASLTSAQVKCARKISDCQCQTESGKYIDLAPLARTDDYQFKRLKGPSGSWQYSFNPCNGFTCEGAANVAVCQEDNSLVSQFALGTESSADFGYILGTGLHVKFTSSHTATTRVSIVKLVCDPTAGDGRFQPTDDGVQSGTGTYNYNSILTSKYACEVDSLIKIGGGGMSVGDILLIVFFADIFAYVLFGFLFNIFFRKKPLGPGALPNATFWVAVVVSVKEGATFCVVKVKQLFTMRRGAYESV